MFFSFIIWDESIFFLTMSPWERSLMQKTEVIYVPSVPPSRSLILIWPRRKLLCPLWEGHFHIQKWPGPLEGPKMAPMTLREGSNPCKAPPVDCWRETQRVMALGKCCLIPSTKVPYMFLKGCLFEYTNANCNVTKWTHPDIEKSRHLFLGTGCRSQTFFYIKRTRLDFMAMRSKKQSQQKLPKQPE